MNHTSSSEGVRCDSPARTKPPWASFLIERLQKGGQMFVFLLHLILWLGVPGVIALALAAAMRGLFSAVSGMSTNQVSPSPPSQQSPQPNPKPTQSIPRPNTPAPVQKVQRPKPTPAAPAAHRWETVECSFCGVAESVASGASGFYCRNCQCTRPVARSSAPNAPTSQIKAVRCSSCGQMSNMARSANQFYCRTCNTTRADTGRY